MPKKTTADGGRAAVDGGSELPSADYRPPSPYIEDDPARLADLQYGRGEFAPDNPDRPRFVVGRDGAGRRCLIPV